MNAQQTITALDQAGVTLTLTASSFKYNGPMTPTLREALVANKAEMREILQARHTSRPTPLALIPDPEGYQDLVDRIALARGCADLSLISDVEAAMEDHLAVMAAATGCADAETLLVQFDRLTALYGNVLALLAADPVIAERWPGDPPPARACGADETHRRYWRRPKVGGWVCARCHPLADGLEVETYEIPAGEGDGAPLPHRVGEGVYQGSLL